MDGAVGAIYIYVSGVLIFCTQFQCKHTRIRSLKKLFSLQNQTLSFNQGIKICFFFTTLGCGFIMVLVRRFPNALDPFQFATFLSYSSFPYHNKFFFRLGFCSSRNETGHFLIPLFNRFFLENVPTNTTNAISKKSTAEGRS